MALTATQAPYELCSKFSKQWEPPFLKTLTKVNLVASYFVSTIENGEFEVGIICYRKS